METNIENKSCANWINVEYFKPMLEKFVSENKQLFIESGYPWGLFVPYVFPNYRNAPLKIFYVGRDTYYWQEIELMLDAFDNGNLESYLLENASAVDLEKRLNWGNGSGAFWSFVNKLHLYIRTGQIKDLNNLTEEDRAILQEVGYGNVNCMELDDTLFYPNKEAWNKEDFDLNKLYLLRKQSKVFDHISHIINAYSPDVVIILNWDSNGDYYIEGTDLIWQKELNIDSLQAVYLPEKSRTKVIWTSHPFRFPRLGVKRDDMIRKLGDLLLSLNS